MTIKEAKKIRKARMPTDAKNRCRLPPAPLRKLMKDRGLKSLELSVMVGCHRNHLNKILAGSILPSRRMAIALGKIFDMDPAGLWMGPKET